MFAVDCIILFMSDAERAHLSNFTPEEWDLYELQDQRSIRGAFYGVSGAILMNGGAAVGSAVLLGAGTGIAIYGFIGGAKNSVSNMITYELNSIRRPPDFAQNEDTWRDQPGDTV